MKKEFYEEYFRLEKDYWFFVSRRKIAIAVLNKKMCGKKDLNILDAGTGTGVMMDFLKKYGKVTGIDKSEDAVAYCRKRGFNNVHLAPAESLPFQNGTFDLICAMDLLEHVENDKILLGEFHRVLKQGGLLFATVPAYGFLWTAHDEINAHKRRYSSHRLKRLIESSNFNVEKFTYFNCILFPFIALIKIMRKFFSKKQSGVRSDFIKIPRWADRLLETIFSFERVLLSIASLPYGVSLMCLACKPVCQCPHSVKPRTIRSEYETIRHHSRV